MAKQKRQNDKQWTYKTLHRKDRATRKPVETGVELMNPGKVSSSCSTYGTRRITLVTNPIIRHEGRKNRIMSTTNGTYQWSFIYTSERDEKLYIFFNWSNSIP
jgi:hypothetical protein